MALSIFVNPSTVDDVDDDVAVAVVATEKRSPAMARLFASPHASDRYP